MVWTLAMIRNCLIVHKKTFQRHFTQLTLLRTILKLLELTIKNMKANNHWQKILSSHVSLWVINIKACTVHTMQEVVNIWWPRPWWIPDRWGVWLRSTVGMVRKNIWSWKISVISVMSWCIYIHRIEYVAGQKYTLELIFAKFATTKIAKDLNPLKISSNMNLLFENDTEEH